MIILITNVILTDIGLLLCILTDNLALVKSSVTHQIQKIALIAFKIIT